VGDTNGKCSGNQEFAIITSLITLILDLVIFIMSFFVVHWLGISSSQRFAIAGLLGAGGSVCIAGILRVYYLILLVKTSVDPTWDSYRVWLSSVVEVQLGIICACFPAMKTFVQHWVAGRRSASAKEPKLETTSALLD
jgi:hypothetical protein